MSALHGDNVVERSGNMDWYDGSSLLHHLEQIHIGSDRNLIDCRFAVQYVIRPRNDTYHDYRWLYIGSFVLAVGAAAVAVAFPTPSSQLAGRAPNLAGR